MRSADHEYRDGAPQVPVVADDGAAPEVPDQPPTDIDKVHGRASPGREGRPQTDVRSRQSGATRHHQHDAVETDVVRRRVPAHDRSGAKEVRADRLEHSVRVQPK